MALSWIRNHLLPGAAEEDKLFRRELIQVGHSGLRALGAIEMGVTLLLHLARWVLMPKPLSQIPARVQTAALVGVGAATTLVSLLKWSRAHVRFLAALSAWLGAGVLIWTSLLMSTQSYGVEDYIPAGLTLVMLSMVAAVPLQPLHTFSLGLSIESLYVFSAWIALRWHLVTLEAGARHHVFILMLTLLSTALSAALYAQRYSSYRAHQQAVRTAEVLGNAQTRALLSESAVSVGKLAAALTHEINTPLGALKSSLDTLLVLAGRQAKAPAAEQPRLLELQAQLRRSVLDSSDRIQKVIARLQRFIDLHKDELQPANLNDLLSDVAILFEREIQGSVKLEFDLQPLRPLICRPQQFTAVFSSLLSNAIKAVNGGGTIRISTRQRNREIEVTIEDSGRGMSPEELETIFDPGFKVSGGRVSTGNWSLFGSRQIIFEHGGEVRITSAEGKGTTVSVRLPC